MLELYTDRLKIRTIKLEDWSLYLSILQDPQLNQFVRDSESLEAIKDKFAARLKPWLFESCEWLTLTIEELATGQPIGFTGLYAKDLVLAQAEVGYMLSQSAQGKGYATESLQAVIDWACLAFQVHKFIGVCAQENKRSQRVLVKCGFQLEGCLRHNYKLNDQWVDDCYYGLLAYERNR